MASRSPMTQNSGHTISNILFFPHNCYKKSAQKQMIFPAAQNGLRFAACNSLTF